MSVRKQIAVLLTASLHYVDAKAKANALLDAYRAEVLAEVAEMLMRQDETAAALLVDRLREAGESRG